MNVDKMTLPQMQSKMEVIAAADVNPEDLAALLHCVLFVKHMSEEFFAELFTVVSLWFS
jgi:hypothetical protein